MEPFTTIDATPKPLRPLNTFSSAELFNDVKIASESLGAIFENLERQTVDLATHGQTGIASDITRLYHQLQRQDEIHREGMEEIRLILEECLNSRLLQHLTEQAEKEIEEEIDKLVEDQVTKCLETIMPKQLQIEIEGQQEDLAKLRMDLHNSESRRANALLRSNQADAALHSIYLPCGRVSGSYPKSLQGLFDIDGEALKTLMAEYEIADISSERDRNLNRFMQFCGVSYQMVRTGPSTRRVGTES